MQWIRIRIRNADLRSHFSFFFFFLCKHYLVINNDTSNFCRCEYVPVFCLKIVSELRSHNLSEKTAKMLVRTSTNACSSISPSELALLNWPCSSWRYWCRRRSSPCRGPAASRTRRQSLCCGASPRYENSIFRCVASLSRPFPPPLTNVTHRMSRHRDQKTLNQSQQLTTPSPSTC